MHNTRVNPTSSRVLPVFCFQSMINAKNISNKFDAHADSEYSIIRSKIRILKRDWKDTPQWMLISTR